MSSNPSQPATPEQALLVTRMIWGALIAGQLAYAGFAINQIYSGADPQSPGNPVCLYIATAMLATLIPAAYFLRNQFYKANWQGNAVTPNGFVIGNVVLLAMMESVSITAITGVMLNHTLLPDISPAFFSLAVQLINFPNGKPMQPAPPAIGE